jgi:predicted ThiF/HesA family dinucleotide-utilizing enzyme
VLGQGPAIAAAAIVALLIGGAVVAPVRSAVLDLLGIAGRERVVRVPGPPDRSRPALDVGRRTTLAAAQPRLAFAIRLPRALGAPREVRYSDAIAGGAVTLVYPGVALLETQGGTDPLFEKRIGPHARARSVAVAGTRGFFVTGAREITVLDRDANAIPATRSLARSDALVWQRDGVAYRLETRVGLRRALAIAASVR